MYFVSPLTADSPNLNVSRCPHCGKLFRGPRSSISLQEHITNIHAAVAPITKFASDAVAAANTTADLNGPSSFRPTAVAAAAAAALFGSPYHQGDALTPLTCTKCSLTFERKEDFDKHQLVHSTNPVQVSHVCRLSYLIKTIYTANR